MTYNRTIGQYRQPILSYLDENMIEAIDELYTDTADLMTEKEITALRYAA